MREDIAVRAAARQTASHKAFDAQRAAHRAETAAWDLLTRLREARRGEPGNLSLVAQADQAEAAYEGAREIAETVTRTAESLAQRALEASMAESRRLAELGGRLRAARSAACPPPGSSRMDRAR